MTTFLGHHMTVLIHQGLAMHPKVGTGQCGASHLAWSLVSEQGG